MKLNVFISYGSKDRQIVDQLATSATPQAEFYYWNKSQEPGEDAWAQIAEWIRRCDLFIVVITGHTVQRGLAVGKEVGIARNQGKKILPLICTRVHPDEITFLEDIAYEPIDLLAPDQAIQRVINYIGKLYQKKKLDHEMLVAQQEHVQASKDSQLQMEQFKVALALGLVFFGIILLTRER